MEEIIMNDSILFDVKKLIGIDESYSEFDDVLIMHINTALSILIQQGIGNPNFYVDCASSTWRDFLMDSQINLRAVKSWTALKVRTYFDPATSSLVKEAIGENLKELEWRMYITENYVGEI